MIDLHCHLLPGIDDGASDLATALDMARIAVADGITLTVCTPHIYPGLYENDAAVIGQALTRLRGELGAAGIPLKVAGGADIQLVPELPQRIRSGTYPTLNGSRYFLFEPPHHAVPTHFNGSIFDAIAHGYVPVITHPERLTWLDEAHYGWMRAAVEEGAWLQVTAGALTGRFGPRAKYWGERLLADGLVHVLATDAHGTQHRPPLLAEGRTQAARWVGEEEAERLVSDRPRAVIEDWDPNRVPQPPALGCQSSSEAAPSRRPKGWWSRLLGTP